MLTATRNVRLWSAALALGLLPTVAHAQVERTSRDSWQRVDDIFAALGAQEGNWIADVGAGGGFFSFRLSSRVGPLGRVLAQDIDERVLRQLHQTAQAEGFENIDTILGAPDDPRLPAGQLDGVLIVNAYHEMDEYRAMLAGIRQALRPGGRLVILDMPPRDATRSRRRQTAQHDIAIDIVAADLAEAGFEVIEQIPDFASSGRNKQWMVVAVVANGVRP
jgi:ubiquinone/menaquinone biosynthesis C-methylase UbiE